MNNLSKFEIWKLASRPKTLPAAISPVILGSALAFNADSFKLIPTISCIIGALLLQIAANLANDYYDFKKGTDPEGRIGPIRVAASGLMDPDELFRGLVFIIFLSVLNGIYLIWIGGYIILLIGVTSIISLMAYSGLRVSYGYYGLGDIFVFVYFGLLAVTGTYFVQTGKFDNTALLGSFPPGFLITAILVVNNYRDMETDSKTGKRTLAVVMGKNLTRIYYSTLIFLSYSVLFIFYFAFDYSWLIFLPILALPLAFELVNDMNKEIEGPRLNLTLAKTAKFGLIFNILFSIGIIVT